MTPFEESVLNYIDDIEETQSITDSRVNNINNNLEIIKLNQQTLISGDLMIIENQKEEINYLVGINMILITTLLLTFIMRCFK